MTTPFGPGAPLDLTALVNAIQSSTSVLTQIHNDLKSGVLVLNPNPPVFTFATLPTTASAGAFAWVSNGRKPAEGAGLGTGVPVFWNPSTLSWFSYLSGAVVTS